MPQTTVRVTPGGALDAAIAAIPASLGVIADFPAEALREAEAAVTSATLPEEDATDVDLVTLDPPGSLDLDQAFAIERAGGGWIVHYAIADVAAFIRPGGALDTEARRRGQTLYAADRRIPLHPDVIGEGAASLLEGETRGAFLWRFTLDAAGQVTETSLRRARVRSRARLDYPGLQATIDAGTATGPGALLPELGEARQAVELARGGASLNRPETLVERTERSDRGYELVRRIPLPVERWNAQISLMTGIAAAELMLAGGVGILRTMPPADPDAVERFRRQTRALGTPWSESQPYGEYLAGLDPDGPGHLAILHAAGSLFRGAGYTAFDGATPEHPEQAALAAPYAHVTAPIRRLVDRFGLLVCAELAAGRRPSDELRATLPLLPKLMGASGNVAGRLDKLTLDTVEAAVLAPRIGETFAASVLTSRDGGGTIQLLDPAVTADCDGELRAGDSIRARLDIADPETATVRFSVATAA